MDQEIGLKITHPVDDLASSSDFGIAKDDSGHVYESQETEGAYILTAHLKGYRKEHVDIDTNKDGTRIIIGLKKPVQEEVMSGRSTKKTKGETRGFRKVFRIPDGVAWKRIKANFNEQESTLTIKMPKLEKEIVGARIEEVKEEGADIGTLQITKAASDEVPEKSGEKVQEGVDIGTPQITQAASGEKVKVVENFHAKGKEIDKEENRNEIQELQAKNPREIQESEESKIVKIKQADGIDKKREDAKETIKEEKHREVENDKSSEASQQVAELSQETEVVKEPRLEKQKTPEKKEVDECESSEMGKGKDVGGKSTAETKPAATEKSNPLRTPLIIVGSALLVSIVLLGINRIRNRKRWI